MTQAVATRALKAGAEGESEGTGTGFGLSRAEVLDTWIRWWRRFRGEGRRGVNDDGDDSSSPRSAPLLAASLLSLLRSLAWKEDLLSWLDRTEEANGWFGLGMTK